MPTASGSSSVASLNAPSPSLEPLRSEPCAEETLTGGTSSCCERCDVPNSPSALDNCGVEGLKESSGIEVDVRVDAELLLEAGCEREEVMSAAVLVLAPTVMREDVVEALAEAEVHDLVKSAVGRDKEGFGVRCADVDARALSSAASAPEAGECTMLNATSAGVVEYEGRMLKWNGNKSQLKVV